MISSIRATSMAPSLFTKRLCSSAPARACAKAPASSLEIFELLGERIVKHDLRPPIRGGGRDGSLKIGDVVALSGLNAQVRANVMGAREMPGRKRSPDRTALTPLPSDQACAASPRDYNEIARRPGTPRPPGRTGAERLHDVRAVPSWLRPRRRSAAMRRAGSPPFSRRLKRRRDRTAQSAPSRA